MLLPSQRIDVLPGIPVPHADPAFLDVAILDMNAGHTNLGCTALVEAVFEAAALEGVSVRAFVFDVRRTGILPEVDRFRVFVGTGGPGHIDPRENDGVAPWSLGIVDDPSWESRLFALFDVVRADEGRSLIAVCHTYGLLCHWSGIARAALRGPEKGGRRKGVVTCVVNDLGRADPFFTGLIPTDGVVTVIEGRQFDLLRTSTPIAEGMRILGSETGGDDPAITMIEFARSADGSPRMLGVNFHPEVDGVARHRAILGRMLAAHEISAEIAAERLLPLAIIENDPAIAEQVRRTYDAFLLVPLRRAIARAS